MAHICSVSELNGYLKKIMDSDANLSGIYVKGEISNYKFHSSGHHYMTIKDDSSVIRAVMFKFDASKLKFRPESGMKIIAKGRVSVFPRDGQYQLYISDMMPDGKGALYVAFEQLKRRLSEEGLFDINKKKAIPEFPEKIAVITSPTGAAVRDILRILKARYPIADVLVCPVLVQGPEAPDDIASMIEYVNRHKLADLIITGRGGGSIEDLWGFNDEKVARAIFASEIPVISAVGHEPDVTISDFVADIRAATPSNAAELAVPDSAALKRELKENDVRILTVMSSKIGFYRETLKAYKEKKVLQSPESYFQERRLALDFLSERLAGNITRTIFGKREKFSKLAAGLDAMSPLKVIARGYSVVSKNGKIIKSSGDVSSGDKLEIKLSDGTVGCTVDKTERIDING